MSPIAPVSTSRSDGVVDEDSLVLVPEDVGAPTSRRLLAWTLVLAFLTLSAGTGLVDRMWPVKPREPLGREKINEDLMRARAHWSDGSRAVLIERDLKETSLVRERVTPYYALALLRAFDEAPEAVVVGREHWLFLRSRAEPPPTMTDEEITASGAATLAALQRRLAQLGIRMLSVPVPRKELLASDFLPKRVDLRPEVEPMFTAELAKRGVEQADLLPSFREMAPNDVYYKYGTHWTESAQLAAAEVIAKELGMWRPEPERRTLIKPLPMRLIESDLINYLGGYGPVYDSLTADGRSQVFNVVPARRDPTTLPPVPSGHVAVIGTSFTAKRKFSTFIQHFISKPVFNAGEGGMDSIEAMRDLVLRRRNGVLPDVMVVEIPIHLLFRNSPFWTSADLFARLPSADGPEIVADPRWHAPQGLVDGSMELDQRWRPIGLLTQGSFAHTGEGVVAVVVQGTVTGGEMIVQVRQSGVVPMCTWPADTHKLVLPLISAVPTSGPLTVVARAKDAQPSSFHIDSVDVIAFGDVDNALELDCGAVTAREGAWSQPMKLENAEPLPVFGVLWIELDPKARIQGAFDVAVELGAGAAPITAHFATIEPGASIAIDLNAARGAQLERVVLSGHGAPPARAAASARILPQDDPLSHGARKPGRASKKK